MKAAIVAIALAAAACGTRAEPAKAPAQTGIGWRQLGSWSGRGNGQTGSFTSESGSLRVRWEARAQTGETAAVPPAAFRVAAHSAISGRLLQPVVDHDGAGQGIGYVQQDPHVFFMVVESSHLNWTLTVEEAVGY
ncbi:MAG TPA: hypothetical protein VH497_07040 [Vicinamibacterales bacterium]|jgi:hypothetical protein